MATDHELAHTHAVAMREHLYPRSVVLLADDPDNPDVVRVPPNGSGTCIEIGGRYLVATAAHNLNDVKALREVAVSALGKIGKFSQQTPKLIGKGRRGGWDYDRMDIAWMEIHPQAVPTWIEHWSRTFVTLDRIWVGPVDENRHVCFLGQPYEYMKRGSINGVPAVGLSPLPYLAKTVRSDDPEHQLCIYYPTEVFTLEYKKAAPDPRGVSGCGLWLLNPTVDGIWTPDRAQLAGIEHGWLEESGCLTGTLMRHWLQMVREDIPELAQVIDPVLGQPVAVQVT